jgi:ankyrin repeat protein/tetratricopeptide (TPR) repeat protein
VQCSDDDIACLRQRSSWGGNTECIKWVLSKAKIDINSINRSGVTAIMLAVYNGQLEAAKELSAKGADLLMSDDDKKTILNWAAEGGHQDCLEWVLAEAKIDVNTADKKYGRTPISYALDNGMLEVAKEMLTRGADLSMKSNKKEMMLSFAVMSNNLDCIEWVLSNCKSLDINAIDDSYICRTPLMLALKSGSEDASNLLVENGASLFMRNKKGTRAVDLHMCDDSDILGPRILQHAIDVRWRSVRSFLLLTKACTNILDDGMETANLLSTSASIATSVFAQSKLSLLIASHLLRKNIIIHDPVELLKKKAADLQSEGRTAEAYAKYVELLAIQKRELEDDYPDIESTITTMMVIVQQVTEDAVTLKSGGQFVEAHAKFSELLVIQRLDHNDDHPDIVINMTTMLLLNDLIKIMRNARNAKLKAVAFEKEGELLNALEKYDKALASETKHLGDSHSKTMATIRFIKRVEERIIGDNSEQAATLESEERYDEALVKLEEFLTVQKRWHLEEDKQTMIDTKERISRVQRSKTQVEAATLERDGKNEEALAKFEELLAMKQSALCDNHPDASLTINDILRVIDKVVGKVPAAAAAAASIEPPKESDPRLPVSDEEKLWAILGLNAQGEKVEEVVVDDGDGGGKVEATTTKKKRTQRRKK